MIGTIRHRAAIDDYRRGRVTQLETNLANRRTVEQAKWKMVEKLGLSEAQAHDKLQRMARDRRRPLIEIAKLVLESEKMPARTPPPPPPPPPPSAPAGLEHERPGPSCRIRGVVAL